MLAVIINTNGSFIEDILDLSRVGWKQGKEKDVTAHFGIMNVLSRVSKTVWNGLLKSAASLGFKQRDKQTWRDFSSIYKDQIVTVKVRVCFFFSRFFL